METDGGNPSTSCADELRAAGEGACRRHAQPNGAQEREVLHQSGSSAAVESAMWAVIIALAGSAATAAGRQDTSCQKIVRINSRVLAMVLCWSRQDGGMPRKPRSAQAPNSLSASDTYVLGFTCVRTVTVDIENAAAMLTVVTLHGAQATRTLALLAQLAGACDFDPDFANDVVAAAQVHLLHEAPGHWSVYAMNMHGVVHEVLEQEFEPVAVNNQPLASMEALVVAEPGANMLWRAHTCAIDMYGLPPLMVGGRATIASGSASAAATVYTVAANKVGVKRDLICAWQGIEHSCAVPVLLPHPFAPTEWFTRSESGTFFGDDGVSLLNVGA
jgi:hypothetical protein